MTYDGACAEAVQIDTKLTHCERYSLEEARLVLKYVLVMGNKMAYAKHIASRTERMCSKMKM